jgi:hypothetical protein
MDIPIYRSFEACDGHTPLRDDGVEVSCQCLPKYVINWNLLSSRSILLGQVLFLSSIADSLCIEATQSLSQNAYRYTKTLAVSQPCRYTLSLDTINRECAFVLLNTNY